ncbi:acetate/propionate family kinase [Endothiovibrio diazotrophicus]
MPDWHPDNLFLAFPWAGRTAVIPMRYGQVCTTDNDMRILTLNSGSSTIKFRLFAMADEGERAGGIVGPLTDAGCRMVATVKGEAAEVACPGADHRAGLDAIVALLARHRLVPEAVGHRIVHGGERFTAATRIDEAVTAAIDELSLFAPLHNPAGLLGIAAARAAWPAVPQVAVFDTAFHHAMPARAYRYALPARYYREHGIRRYGFHGTSHAYVAECAANHLGRPLSELNIISLHLGQGASAAAIAGGRSIDTSMGMTPLEGLVMGTRSGDLDPALPEFIARTEGWSPERVDQLLNHESGLLGLCGSGDLREVHRRRAAGDAEARLALELFCYRIRKYVGAYAVALGRLDALIFTAGIGEHDPHTRQAVCDGLGLLGVELDPARNRSADGGVRAIHSPGSRVGVLVVPTNEELAIARQTRTVLEEPGFINR